MKIKLHSVPKWIAIAFILILFLFGNTPLFNSNAVVDFALNLFSSGMADPKTRWLIVLCLVFNFLILAAIHACRRTRSFWRLSAIDLWCIAFFLLGIFATAQAGSVAQATDLIALLAAAAFAKALSICVLGARSSPSNKAQFSVILLLLALFAVASLISLPENDICRYRSRLRWCGPWDNPNIAGLLMGAGIVLLAGSFSLRFKPQCRAQDPVQGCTRNLWKRFLWVLGLLAALSLGRSLLNSLSRGAWLAASCGLGYLFVFRLFCYAPETDSASPPKNNRSWDGVIHRARKNLIPLLAISLSLLVLCFWHCRHSESHLARRACSVFNANDFSLSNRLTAWTGAFQIMKEHPWFGISWSQPTSLYEQFYLPPKVSESAAFQINDFLRLGTTFGIPALFCFALSLWLSFAHGKAALPPENQAPQAWQRDWLKATCRAAAIAMLVAFWFGGGLFRLSSATVFWILLELGRGDAHATADSLMNPTASLPSRLQFHLTGKLLQPRFLFPVLVASLFFATLFWARSNDPLIRQWFQLETPHGNINCVAVLPKPLRPCPVVLYLHDSEKSLLTDGDELRQFTQLGMAAVSLDYNQTNWAAFEAQMSTLLQHLRQQPWALSNSVAWVGCGFGAQHALRFLLKHPGTTPSLLACVAANWRADFDPEVTSQHLRFQTPTVLIHGEQDETLPADKLRTLARLLAQNGNPVQLKLLPGLGHRFELHRSALIRQTGEYIKARLTPAHPQPEFARSQPVPFWLCTLPCFLWAGYWAAKTLKPHCSHQSCSTLTKNEIGLRLVAGILLLWASVESALQFSLPRAGVNPNTLHLAQSRLLDPKWEPDFLLLASQPFWQKQKLDTLLTHVELAHYCAYELINWKIPPELYPSYVLSPAIQGSETEMNWRRPLWEFFYPRIRKQNTPHAAAEIVALTLRATITVCPGLDRPQGIETIWTEQITGEKGFQRILVAALRSVGVPSKLNTDDIAEFWDGKRWRLAPQALSF